MAQQAQTVELPKRLPLVIEPSNRGESTAYDARLVNCYTESHKGAEGQEYWIYPRFGTTEQSRPPAGNATGRGLFNWLGDIYSIFGAKIYKNGVDLGATINATNGNYRFDSCLGATPKLQFGDGVKAYNYDSGAGVVQITDVDFPASFVKGWAYLNGTSYVGLPNAHIQGDDPNDPTSWPSLNDILAQIEPDQQKALSKQLVYVISLKQWSVEVFYDAGNATGSPLGRVEGSKQNWGCLSGDSVRQIDGAILWLGAARDANPEVLMLNNLKLEPVSTKPIERLLTTADISSIYSWTAKYFGHRFYVLTLKNNNLTLAFDIDERAWSQWTDASGNYLPIVDSCMTSGSTITTLLQHESNGRIYTLDPTVGTDAGAIIPIDIYTPNFDGGTRRKKQMGRLAFVTDQRAGAVLQVRVNDSDYDPTKWTNFRRVDLSQKNPYLPDCGSFYRRVHNLHYASPVPMPRIQAVEMQIDVGTL